MDNAREIALNIIMKFEKNDAFSNILLNNELNKADISEIDKRFVTQLVYGVVSNKIAIDYIIKNLSKVKINKTKLHGLFQLYYFMSYSKTLHNCSQNSYITHTV